MSSSRPGQSSLASSPASSSLGTSEAVGVTTSSTSSTPSVSVATSSSSSSPSVSVATSSSSSSPSVSAATSSSSSSPSVSAATSSSSSTPSMSAAISSRSSDSSGSFAALGASTSAIMRSPLLMAPSGERKVTRSEELERELFLTSHTLKQKVFTEANSNFFNTDDYKALAQTVQGYTNHYQPRTEDSYDEFSIIEGAYFYALTYFNNQRKILTKTVRENYGPYLPEPTPTNAAYAYCRLAYYFEKHPESKEIIKSCLLQTATIEDVIINTQLEAIKKLAESKMISSAIESELTLVAAKRVFELKDSAEINELKKYFRENVHGTGINDLVNLWQAKTLRKPVFKDLTAVKASIIKLIRILPADIRFAYLYSMMSESGNYIRVAKIINQASTSPSGSYKKLITLLEPTIKALLESGNATSLYEKIFSGGKAGAHLLIALNNVLKTVHTEEDQLLWQLALLKALKQLLTSPSEDTPLKKQCIFNLMDALKKVNPRLNYMSDFTSLTESVAPGAAVEMTLGARPATPKIRVPAEIFNRMLELSGRPEGYIPAEESKAPAAGPAVPVKRAVRR